VLLPLLEAGPPEDDNLPLPPADGVGPSAEVMDVSKAALELRAFTDFCGGKMCVKVEIICINAATHRTGEQTSGKRFAESS